jgi:hypothetical protein
MAVFIVGADGSYFVDAQNNTSYTPAAGKYRLVFAGGYFLWDSNGTAYYPPYSTTRIVITHPGSDGVAVCRTGANSWGACTAANITGNLLTGYSSGAGTIADTDTILQAIQKLNGNVAAKAPLASPNFTGVVTVAGAIDCPTIASAAQGTANINIDGASACDYNYSNGASAATYTPVITAPPAANKVRYITITLGGGAGVVTLTATNITWIGTAGAAATTTNKKSTYVCIIPASGNALCKIVAEAY